jgi:hypothetical protein
MILISQLFRIVKIGNLFTIPALLRGQFFCRYLRISVIEALLRLVGEIQVKRQNPFRLCLEC